MFNFNKPLSSSRQHDKLKFHMEDTQGVDNLTSLLAEYIVNAGDERQIVVLCIGTDRSTGDCLGPLVGSHLQESAGKDLLVVGTLDSPVHASNLQQTLNELNCLYPNSFVIAVDACLGRLDSVGYISLSRGSLKPGAGVHKNLPQVGEAHLTGVVNVGGFMEYMVLQNTRLSMVMKMAKRISAVVLEAYNIARNDVAATK